MVEAREHRAAGGEIVLGQNNYGKSEIRLVKVKRDTARHELWDLDVRVVLEGDFGATHVEGDNSGLLATDTMRNTVYALAKDHLTGSIEDFGLKLVDHFLKTGPTVESCRVEITQFPWHRIEVDGRGHDHSFVRGRGERRAKVSGDGGGERRVEAGVGEVYVLKTTESGFEGFLGSGSPPSLRPTIGSSPPSSLRSGSTTLITRTSTVCGVACWTGASRSSRTTTVPRRRTLCTAWERRCSRLSRR